MTEDEGVIDGWGDEIDGGNNSQFRIHQIHPCIVVGIKTHEYIGILFLLQFIQQILQSDRTEFCCSTAGLGQTRQGWFLKYLAEFHD